MKLERALHTWVPRKHRAVVNALAVATAVARLHNNDLTTVVRAKVTGLR